MLLVRLAIQALKFVHGTFSRNQVIDILLSWYYEKVAQKWKRRLYQIY